jgi:hypothetical protein
MPAAESLFFVKEKKVDNLSVNERRKTTGYVQTDATQPHQFSGGSGFQP